MSNILKITTIIRLLDQQLLAIFTDLAYPRIIEEDLHSAVEARTETLQSLRELGPPDLVHLIKQSAKSSTKQVHRISKPKRSRCAGEIWMGIT